jgi:hypothetical protein
MERRRLPEVHGEWLTSHEVHAESIIDFFIRGQASDFDIGKLGVVNRRKPNLDRLRLFDKSAGTVEVECAQVRVGGESIRVRKQCHSRAGVQKAAFFHPVKSAGQKSLAGPKRPRRNSQVRRLRFGQGKWRDRKKKKNDPCVHRPKSVAEGKKCNSGEITAVSTCRSGDGVEKISQLSRMEKDERGSTLGVDL